MLFTAHYSLVPLPSKLLTAAASLCELVHFAGSREERDYLGFIFLT